MEEHEKNETKKKDPLDIIIFPEFEPNIINTEMIIEAYLNVFVGEKQRLHGMEEIRLEDIHTLRLEFKNLLRIDNLDVLPNLTTLILCGNSIEIIENLETITTLKELDLSLNKIQKIENLDKLVNLEKLLLSRNFISKIENLDNLVNLKILSISNNRITTTDGLPRLRFLKHFKSLSLEGNPIAKMPDFPLDLYIMAILPNLVYYDFKFITVSNRELAIKKFVVEVRTIAAEQETEVKARLELEREKADEKRLMGAFVEHLNGHQLYRSLWENDEDSRVLMSVGMLAEELAAEYDEKMFELTQEIYKYGLEKYNERLLEDEEFQMCIEEGQAHFQELSRHIIEDYIAYKEVTMDDQYPLIRKMEQYVLDGGDEETPEYAGYFQQLEGVMEIFDWTTNNVWRELMEIELHQHETIEETIVNYGRNLHDIISKFIEHVQTFFSQLRDLVQNFVSSMESLVSEFLIIMFATQDFGDVLPELKHCIEDREALENMLVGMKDTHTGRIDEREDRLITRSKGFVEDLIRDLKEKEEERHGRKIYEINDFINYNVESWEQNREDIRENLLKYDDKESR